MAKKWVKKKKRKIKLGRLFLLFCISGLLIYIGIVLFNTPIKNIYVIGNEYMTEQEIIEQAGLEQYPNLLDASNYKIKKRLSQHLLIHTATVFKKWGKRVFIEIVENRPLFYDLSQEKTILYDGQTTTEQFMVPTLINYIPNTKHETFLKKMATIDVAIIHRISEIKYDPNDVDKDRFLLSMDDGNYVYLNFTRFENINQYIDIIEQFPSKKGILYLDSGEYFEILQEE